MGFRLNALNFWLRLVVKPWLARVQDPEKLRRAFAIATGLTLTPPPLTALTPGILTGKSGSVGALWVQNGVPRREGVILYLHGGGYVAGSPATHAPMLASLSLLTGMQACLPDYRLAPEHPFPAAIEDAALAYRVLLAKGYRTDQIVLGGDSAGGGLMLALLAHILNEKMPPPAGAFAMSPWTDLTLAGDSLRTNKTGDPLLPVGRIAELRDMYLGEGDPGHPLASSLFADFKGAPPILIQVGSTEILRDDSARLAQVLKEQGVAVTLDIWENTPHVWQIFGAPLPEATRALVKISDFIREITAV